MTLDGFGPAVGLVQRGLLEHSWHGDPPEPVFPASDSAMTALMRRRVIAENTIPT